MKRFNMFAVGVVLSFVLVGCASHGTSPKGLEIPIEKAAIKFAADTKSGTYKVVTTEDLKKWIDEKKPMVIVSALPAEEDATFGKLPGAVNGMIPKTEKELTPADKERIIAAAGPDKGKTVVVYCGFVACRRSHIGAVVLVENGYTEVYRFAAGITGWAEMKFPLVK